MPTIAFGDQVWDAADPIFEEDEGHFRVEDIVTVVEHEHVKETDLEVDTIDADDIVTGDLEATTIETSYVKSDGIDVDMLHTSVMEVTDELIYRNQQYVVSNKFQPLDLANVQADEEDAPYDTIVTRSLVNGTRINNLQVRADDTTAFQSSGPQGNFPGLFFTEGWCSERLTMLEDGHGLYIVADEQGVVDPDAFVRWGTWPRTCGASRRTTTPTRLRSCRAACSCRAGTAKRARLGAACPSPTRPAWPSSPLPTTA